MKVSFDIKCNDYSAQPAYRVWINGELMTERDFVIPAISSVIINLMQVWTATVQMLR